MNFNPIPVWVFTGYLGSGKTTLLAQWLRHEALSKAALIVNEIGETGFDDRMLAQSVESATSLLSNQCICCTGLLGLEETLTELWWARLRRERPRFDAVLVETTGLANPRQLVKMFDLVPLLRERYILQGVVTAVSAVAGLSLLAHSSDAQAQVQAADAIVVTKIDRADAETSALLDALNERAARAPVLLSAQASVPWECIATAVADGRRAAPEATATVADSVAPVAAFQPRGMSMFVSGAASHGVKTAFHEYTEPVELDAWPAWLGWLLTPGVQRLKGIVRLNNESLVTVQWSLGDARPEFMPFTGLPPKLGITAIHSAFLAN